MTPNYFFVVATGKKPKTEKEDRVKHIKVIFGGSDEKAKVVTVLVIPVLSHKNK